MNPLLQQLLKIPKGLENQIAIETSETSITYAALAKRVKTLSFWLTEQKANSVALHADNSIDWVVVDLACQWHSLFSLLFHYFSLKPNMINCWYR